MTVSTVGPPPLPAYTPAPWHQKQTKKQHPPQHHNMMSYPHQHQQQQHPLMMHYYSGYGQQQYPMTAAYHNMAHPYSAYPVMPQHKHKVADSQNIKNPKILKFPNIKI